jgi:hypothetical protein
MEKMDFVLPDFTRINWVSQQAEERWANRLARIKYRFSLLEVLSVSERQRRCCIVCVSPVELVEQVKFWLKYDLSFLPIDRIGVSRFIYSSTAVPLAQNNNFVYKVVVGKPKELKKFLEAWTSSNDLQIGSLLGYPECCIRFFNNHWTIQGHIDTTWAMAMQTGNKHVNDRIVEIDGPPHTNILWRWVGVRAVPHLPCSFDCKNTITFAKAFWKCANASQSKEYEWLNEILSWPVEWTALHGIAEIKTPILKVTARSDATPNKYTVKKIGHGYPPEGAKGLLFPYRLK